MQLAILTAVLAAIAAAEGGGGPVQGLPWRLAAVFGAALAAPLAALAARNRMSQSIAADGPDRHVAARIETAILAIWLAAVAFMLLVGQWPRIVRANWALADWPLVDEIAILLPVVAPLVLIWAAMYRLHDNGATHESLLSHLALQARHHLALILLPPLFVVGLIETIAALKIAPQLDTVWWFAVPQLAIVLVLMPLAVRRLWKTTPLVEQPLRATLDEICASRGAHVREILVWQTSGTMANAAVVGMSRFLRYLLLTDLLLNELTDDQIAAVVRHELAHVRRWHLPLRLALLLLPVAWWIVLKQTFPAFKHEIGMALTALGLPSSQIIAAAIPLLMLSYTVIVVGWYSRLLEHDADIDSCLDSRGQFDACAGVDFSTALLKLCGDGQESWFSRWLHPPVRSRVKLLESIAGQPDMLLPWRRNAMLVALFVATLYVAAASILLMG